MPLKRNTKDNILDMIGDTPLLSLNNILASSHVQLFAKMEMQNPGGSIKDRTSKLILSNALLQGQINQDTVIIESTSGNMGIGLAQICLIYGLKLILVVDPHINHTAIKILEAYGAELCMVQEHDGFGGYLKTRLRKVEELKGKYPNSFNPDQYHNIYNPLAHRQTVDELVQDLGGFPDYIFVPTSTCGTIMGLAQELKIHGAPTKVIAVDACGSMIFGSAPQERLIPGIGSSQVSPFLDLDFIGDIIHVNDMEMITGCYALLHQESVFAGGSSGAVIQAIAKYSTHFKANDVVVAIFADRGERYVDTIYNPAWVQTHFPDYLTSSYERLDTRKD